MSASFLPWWGWILIAVILYVIGLIGYVFYDAEHYDKSSPTILGTILKTLWLAPWALMVISAIIGVIRFIKWVWIG